MKVHRSAGKHGVLPEDAVQAALEKAWRKRTSLRDERYLRTWLTRILIHACYDILRRRKREIRFRLRRMS